MILEALGFIIDHGSILKGDVMAKKLYIGNLPYSTTDENLEQVFSRWGSVASVKIIKDRETGRSRGFGFIEMESEDAAEDAIRNMHGQDFEGRELTVCEARPPQARPMGYNSVNRTTQM